MSRPAYTACLLETAFHLDAVEPTPDPTGGNASWFRYTISQGPDRTNTISGAKPGSLNEVHLQLAEMVDHLNQRFGKLDVSRKGVRR
jgi:hypothetical protein